MTYTPPATQEDLDRIIADRLTRQETKIRGEYADYEDLKNKAAQFDKAQDASKTELQKALDRIEATEKELNAFKTEKQSAAAKAAQDKQVADWTAEVAKTKGVPAELLKGSTKEELEAHADVLKPVIVASRNGVVPNEGETTPNVTSEERAVVAQLFGNND
ncbi:hypothetical protein ATK74_0818 [Propionicimonas paludicola]|uniref:Minor structural protein GP20 n=1 Tax=Propionicimonas paludicola TaxID=185243 RepID=A0A2A9CPD2_9ACTN|nr:hypothetical protein [Propionicimonas paludicola]PFG16284.1 hypothetical protein ATK74_0818 [Propionicimonas paludicola]